MSKKIGRKLLLAMALPLFSLQAQAQGVVTIDQNMQRFIGKESAFDRSKYFNIHSWFAEKDADFEKFKAIYNLDADNMGSRMFRNPLQKHKNGVFPAIEKKYSGIRHVDNYVATGQASSILYKKDADYSTEDISDFSQKATKYAVAYYRDQSVSVPKYFEPFNEPMIKANAFYPEGRKGKNIADKSNKVTSKMCEFHRDLAKEIHVTPELAHMKVIGYGSAFPEFEANNFGLWNNRYKDFIDIAGKDIDLFSLHLYDGSGVNNKGGRRSGSNAEAILDMVETYSNKTLGMVKPIAITEYGRLVPDQPNYQSSTNYVPVVNSQAVRSQMHLVMNFMERGQDIALSIPFTVGKQKATDKYSKSALWIKNGKGGWDLTQRKYFFEIWKTVKGDRVYIHSTNVDVQTQAFVDGKQLFVVLNNLNDTIQKIDLNMVNPNGVKNVSVKRLNIFVDKTPELTETTQKTAPSTIDLNYGETVVLTYNFKSSIKFNHTIYSKKYYSDTYLQPIVANQNSDFTFNGVDTGKGEATLRLSVGRDHGLSLLPIVSINGKEIAINGDVIRGDDQQKRSRFFGTLEIPVNIDLIKSGINHVSVKFGDAGGHVSSVILQVEKQQ